MLVNHYDIKVILKPGVVDKKSSFKHTKSKVVLENDSFLVLDDSMFTKLDKTVDFCYPKLGKVLIYSNINDDFYGTRITYSLYTSKMKKTSTIKKEIQKYIDENLCFKNVDLSFMGGD